MSISYQAVGWNRAKRVIMVYLQGGPSHLDLWDPKDNVPDNVRSPFKRIASKVPGMDVTELLERLGLPEGAPKGLRVAYHAACSLQHGQKVTGAPKALLKRAGFEVVEPANPHLCCGSAGTYNLLQPEISGELRARKVAALEAKAPDVIAAGNIGCMMQIGSGTAVPVVHTVELLDWATGGPLPPSR